MTPNSSASLGAGRGNVARAAALLVGVVVARPVTAADITACDQSVAADDTGVLQADLDCSASPVGVRLLRGATLELNGHTIAGGDATWATVAGVRRPPRRNPIGTGRGEFTIVGPGVIEGTEHHPSTLIGTDSCVALNHGSAVIDGGAGTVEIRGCIIGVRGGPILKANGDYWPKSPEGRGHVELSHVALDDGQWGTVVRTLVASDVTASGNHEFGLGAVRQATVHDITVNGNGIGIFGGKLLVGDNVTASNNDTNGVDTCGFGHTDLTNVVANQNGLFGVCGDSVALADSTVLDNGYRDVASRLTMPVLTNTVCGTSADQNSLPWGVCAND